MKTVITFLIGFIFAFIVLALGYLVPNDKPQFKLLIKPEYIVELISNDTVLIQSDDIIYKCHYKDIQKTIDKDNL